MPTKKKFFLGGTALFFLACYLWWPFFTPPIFNSPDETASAFFIGRLAETGDFFASEPLNYFLAGAARPRSILWNGYALTPQGFAGLPIFYGWLARISGLAAVKFFTPLLAVLGGLAFYGIVKIVFGRRTAAVSFILLMMFPAYWYYASRYLYPNVPFVAMLIIAVWAAVKGALHRNAPLRYWLVFSVFWAGALAMRPVEALWAAPLLIFGLWRHRQGLSVKKIFYSLIAMSFLALPIVSVNLFFYGSVFGSGYTLSGQAGAAAAAGANSAPHLKNLFPFGLHPRTMASNVCEILIKYFWFYSVPIIAGLLIFCFARKSKAMRTYAAAAFLLFAWLVFFYGGGVFADNPSGRLTIGDSHFRYWLPVFAAFISFAGFAADKIIFRLRPLYKNVILASGFIFMATMSAQAAVFSLDDGLAAIKNNLEKNYEIKKAVITATEEGSIIITGRQDKIFFPGRRVIYAEEISDPRLLYKLSAIKNEKFYYYGIAPDFKRAFAMENMLKFYGFHAERLAIFGNEALYSLEKLSSSASIK